MCDSLESRDSERQWRIGFVVKGPDERWMGSTTSASRRRCMHVQDGRALRLVYVMTPVASQSHSVHGNTFLLHFTCLASGQIDNLHLIIRYLIAVPLDPGTSGSDTPGSQARDESLHPYCLLVLRITTIVALALRERQLLG